MFQKKLLCAHAVKMFKQMPLQTTFHTNILSIVTLIVIPSISKVAGGFTNIFHHNTYKSKDNQTVHDISYMSHQ